DNTSYDRALESLRARFGAKVVPLTIPIGEQAAFSGLVDLISGKAYTFSDSNMATGEMPASVSEAAQRYREQLVETAVESNDDLMAKYLEGEELSEAELRHAVKVGVAAGTLVPALAGSVAKNIGIQPLLDAITAYVPSAAERPDIKPSGPPAAF